MASLRHSNYLLPVLALVLLTSIWGYSWIMMKSVMQYIGAADFSALRSLLGTALLFLLLKLRGKSMSPPPLVPTVMIGVLQTAGMVGLAQWALVMAGAGKVAILSYTMPFWVIILAALFLRERMKRCQYIAIVVAGAGLLLVLQPWSLQNSWFAYMLSLASGLSWGISAIIAKKLYARRSVDLLTLTAWQMLFGALLLSLVALAVPQREIIWEPYLFIALFYSSVLATAVAWILWLFILKNLPASLAGLGTLLVPAQSVLLAWWLLDETPDQFELIGIVAILLALVMVHLPSSRNSPTSSHSYMEQ